MYSIGCGEWLFVHGFRLSYEAVVHCGCSEHGRDVWRMLHDEKGSMYVCGATQMGDDVKHAVVDIAMEHGGALLVAFHCAACILRVHRLETAGMTKEAALQWLKDIHERYIVELW
jgi:hypothetical protein